MLRPHQEAPQDHPAAAPGPAKRRRPLTYRLHAGGGGQETMQGRGKTEQRTVRNRRLSHLWSPVSHHSQPHPPAWPGGVARDHAGNRNTDCPGARGWGEGRGACGSWDTHVWSRAHTTCVHDAEGHQPHLTPPTQMCPGPTPRTLTFLHRDGWFFLPQPQQDEEEDQRDEDLESQDPLEKAGGVRPPAQGWTGQT